MKTELKLLHDRVRELQMAIHNAMAGIPNSIAVEEIPDLVDAGFLCREIANMSEDIKKISENRKTIIGRFLAARASVAAMQGSIVDLRGEYASASADIQVKPKFPEEDTAEYFELMRWIGLSDEMIQRGMLRPSFTKIQEELTKRVERGEKPPPGIMNTFTDAQVVFRRRK